MTFKEMNEKRRECQRRAEEDQRVIVDFARQLPPMLKDHGLHHLANELGRLLFTLDAHKQEEMQWLQEHAEEIVEALVKHLENPK